MTTSRISMRGVFYPDELEEMRDELSRGDVPDETSAEREGRAQEIFERNRSKGEANPAADHLGSSDLPIE